MSEERGPVLAGLHIPKTGGTTLRHHVETRLGKSECYASSHLHASRRVLRGDPLLPLYKRKRLHAVRFYLGHAPRLEEIFLLDCTALRVFTMLRDPVDHLVSRYKHTLRHSNDASEIPSFATFVAEAPADQMARKIRSTFGRLVDPVPPLSEAGLHTILAKLDYVLWTDSLDHQVAELCSLVGAEGVPERRRIYRDDVDLDGMTRADIEALSPIDTALASAMRERGASRIGNPFASERTDWAAARKQLAPQMQDPIREVYFAVFDYMRANHMLHAYSLSAEARDDPASLIFARYVAERNIDLSARQPTIRDQVGLAVFLIDTKRGTEATALLRGLAEEAPDDFLVQFNLARALGRRELSTALAACKRALALNPMNQNARDLLSRLSGDDQLG